MAHRDTAASSSLAAKLMAVAAEHELHVKREKQRLEARLAELTDANAEAEQRNRQQAFQIESLTRKLEEAVAEVQKYSATQEERMDSLLFELIAVKFDLADKAREVERLKRELTGSTDEAGDEKDGKSTQSTSPVPEREGDTDLHSREMLFLAAEEGLDEIVKGILNPKPGHHHRALGATFGHAVRHAARAGHVNIIKRLLAVDAYLDVRSTDEDCLYQTCLHGAAAHGHEPVVRLILTHCKEKLQALAQLQQRDKDAVLDPQVLARHFTVDVNDQDALGRTPLHLAAEGGHASVLKCLLLHGADPDIVDDASETALGVAQRVGASSATRILSDPSVLFWNSSVRANRLYNDKRFDAAIQAYSVAIRFASDKTMNTTARDLATLHYNRARASYRLGRHCAAIEDCCTALDRDPTYRNAIAQRAECYMSLFEFDKASRDFQSLVDADPSDRQWNRRLSDARTLRDMTHYQVLGVVCDADAATIKKAYRMLCLRWHPDKHTTSQESQQRANTAYMRINEANDVLNDSYKRMLYDLEKRPAILSSGSKGSDLESFDKWYSKEREREVERAREIESLLDAESLATEARLKDRSVAKARLHAMTKQQQMQAEQERLMEAEASRRVQKPVTIRAPPVPVATALPVSGVSSVSKGTPKSELPSPLSSNLPTPSRVDNFDSDSKSAEVAEGKSVSGGRQEKNSGSSRSTLDAGVMYEERSSADAPTAARPVVPPLPPQQLRSKRASSGNKAFDLDAVQSDGGVSPAAPDSPPLPFVIGQSEAPLPPPVRGGVGAAYLDTPPGYTSSTATPQGNKVNADSGSTPSGAATHSSDGRRSMPDVESIRASLLSSWEEQRREAEEIRVKLLLRKERLAQVDRSPSDLPSPKVDTNAAAAAAAASHAAAAAAAAAAGRGSRRPSQSPGVYLDPDDTLPSVESEDDEDDDGSFQAAPEIMSPHGGDGDVRSYRRPSAQTGAGSSAAGGVRGHGVRGTHRRRSSHDSLSPSKDLNYSDVLDEDEEALFSDDDDAELMPEVARLYRKQPSGSSNSSSSNGGSGSGSGSRRDLRFVGRRQSSNGSLPTQTGSGGVRGDSDDSDTGGL